MNSAENRRRFLFKNMFKGRRFTVIIISLFFCMVRLSAIESIFEPAPIEFLRKAYPDYTFRSSYDDKFSDWVLHIYKGNKAIDLFWAEGRLLPQDKLGEKAKYEKLLYWYPDKAYDPATFTQKNIEHIKEVTSKESRQNSNITPPFFFDFIYDSKTQLKLEEHIVGIKFLGFRLNVHERIKDSVKKIEAEIKEAALTDKETADLLKKLDSVGGYNWRSISDSGSRSFHSLGIAVDILPKKWNQKNVYWSWRHDWDPDNWMMVPLDKRWSPPQKVIEIFEDNGFIWGGKWIVWDQMHFEYRPELLIYKKEINKRNSNK